MNARLTGTAVLLCVLLALTVGCSREQTPPGPPAKPTAEAPAIDLPRFKANELSEILRRHAGKVVLVDFWASWCEPCIEAFPSLIAWQKKHGGDGLVIVSVATDRASNRKAVIDVIAKFEPPFEFFLLDAPDYDAFVRGVSEQWDGGVPAVFLYGRTGALRHYFGAAHEPAEIEGAIKALLAEAKQPRQNRQ